MTNRIIIKIFSTILFILFGELCLSYEAPIPETIYSTSQNQQYLLEILPILEAGAKKVDFGINRNKLTVLVYEKQSRRISGIEKPLEWWQEISFFRVYHPYNAYDGPAEVRRAFILNDGSSIFIESMQHPWSQKDTEIMFIYDRQGNLVASYSSKNIYLREGQFIRTDYEILFDNPRNRIMINYDSKNKIIIDLKSGKLVRE